MFAILLENGLPVNPPRLCGSTSRLGQKTPLACSRSGRHDLQTGVACRGRAECPHL